MLRRLIGDKMEEVIEAKHQVEESKEQAGDEYYKFHENFFALDQFREDFSDYLITLR